MVKHEDSAWFLGFEVLEWQNVRSWINERRQVLLRVHTLANALDDIEQRTLQRGVTEGLEAARDSVHVQLELMERLLESTEKFGQMEAAAFLKGGVGALRVIYGQLCGDDANPS